tara:strand:- start:80 stop:394 length:315 start_codon:yes stop_codon:yes gene_type:complete
MPKQIPSLADQLLKPVSRYDKMAPILEKHGHDQTKYYEDRDRFQEIYDQWKDLLKLIPGLSQGHYKSQQIAATFKHPGGDGWAPGFPAEKRPTPDGTPYKPKPS